MCEYFYKNHFFSEVYYIFSSTFSCCYLFVRIESYEGNLVLKNIKSFYQRSRPIFFNVNQITRKLFKEKSVFLLSTSEGILNSIEALHLGIGGLVLFEYY